MWTETQLWFTYGPQTKDDAVLRTVFASGATGVRLTFSFGTPELQAERAHQVKRAAREVGVEAVVVADVQGEKCRFARVGDVSEIPVTPERAVLLTPDTSDLQGSPVRIAVQVPRYLTTLEPGDVIIEGDGALQLLVEECSNGIVACRPLQAGVIHPGRGLLVQKSSFQPNAVTEKDAADLAFIGRNECFDGVAVSFVSTPEDVRNARRCLGKENAGQFLVSKIETELGIRNAEAIAAECDVLMAARGDLALTMPYTELYASVSRLASIGSKWILATQLMEGLERFAIPTRPELCDLPHWLSMGAAGVMLSYETAFGSHPVEAVRFVKGLLDRYRSPR